MAQAAPARGDDVHFRHVFMVCGNCRGWRCGITAGAGDLQQHFNGVKSPLAQRPFDTAVTAGAPVAARFLGVAHDEGMVFIE